MGNGSRLILPQNYRIHQEIILKLVCFKLFGITLRKVGHREDFLELAVVCGVAAASPHTWHISLMINLGDYKVLLRNSHLGMRTLWLSYIDVELF